MVLRATLRVVSEGAVYDMHIRRMHIAVAMACICLHVHT